MTRVIVDGVTLDIPIVDARRSLRSELLAEYAGGYIRGDRKTRRVAVRALDNVSVQVGEGMRLGLIGHNGSGKTTLLRTIAGIYQPTSGTVITRGRVTPLFNPLFGLEQDDTGYENIFNIGFFLGMGRAELMPKLDEIMAFCELGAFLDLPVRTYSAGMLMRLAFAITTTIDTDILLLDEAIGTGDARFAHRAEQRINDLCRRVGALVLASHSTELIEKLCNYALLLEHGQVLAQGEVTKVLDIYHKRVRAQQGEEQAAMAAAS